MRIESRPRVYFGGRCHDHHQKRQINPRNRAFFSGILSQVVSGLEFFVFSLVDVAERKAYPLCAKQTVRSEAEKAAIKRAPKEAVEEVESEAERTT